MAYWLFKSEPGTWSWDDQVKKGDVGEGWNGVRNYQANNNMKAMKVGDKGFFYHSVNEKRIVGTVEVIEEWHLDPSDEKGRFGMVTIKALETAKNPVTLEDVKAHPDLSEMALLKQSRLSVQPVEKDAWKVICKMAGVKG